MIAWRAKHCSRMDGTGPQDGETTAHLEGGMAECNDPPKRTGENR